MSGDDSIPTILGLCNPLLDITANVDASLLSKYNLEPNNAILASEEHKTLCKELTEKYQVEYTAGGSAQNVMRVAAGLLKCQNFKCRVLFTGGVGTDEFGSLMASKAKEDGVEINYFVTDSEPTGTCAVCLTNKGKDRSLCAFLGASQKFTDEHLKSNWDSLVANTNIIYMTGFLIAVSPASFHILGEHVATCKNDEKRFCLNLSAAYVSAVFGNELDKVMKYVDILFGNDDEVFAYAKHKQWETKDLKEIVVKIAKGDKVRESVSRVVVVTQGHRPVILCRKQADNDASFTVEEIEVNPIPQDQIVDTNGAGDAFAGGFLSQYIQGGSLERCVQIGTLAAQEIIKLSGVAVPKFANLPTF